ncbi:glycogen debranching protein [Streptomyces sp. F-3]|nr:glycogen debranching protein [Streptomyces sp. F-3]
MDFTRYVIGLRAAHPVLRRRRFFQGGTATRDDQPLPDLVWLLPDGREMSEEDWQRSDAHSVAVFLNGDAIAEPDGQGRPVVDDSFLLLLNGYWEPVGFRLPGPVYGERWTCLLDTTEPTGLSDEPEYKPGDVLRVASRSLVLLTRPPRTAR